MPTLYIQGVDLGAIAAEGVLAVGGLLLLLGGAFAKRTRPGPLVVAALAIVAVAAGVLIPSIGHGSRAFDDTVAIDGFAIFLKMALLAAAALTLLALHGYLRSEGGPIGEALGLVLFATAGMVLMTAATDLIVIFIALETFSLALYILVALRRGRADGQEGSLKYFLTGAFSSAFFLYGIALVYGATGTTRLLGIARSVREVSVLQQGLLVPGMALLAIGLVFKISAVPFHMWTPDAYQGAPAPVAGFMAAGSKIAGFAVALRLFYVVFPSLRWDWQPILIVISVASMLLGSFAAIAQRNLKRMLAYSAIAHTGFVLIGLIAANERGVSGSLFYLAVYAVTITGAFAVIYAVGGAGESLVELSDYRGLWRRQPFLAAVLAVDLISLAGIPPTAGFWAKFEVFSAGVSGGLTPVVVIAVLTSAVAAFFYLRVIVAMFLEDDEAPEPSSTHPSLGIVMIVSVVLILLVGILPSPLLDAARHAGFAFH